MERKFGRYYLWMFELGGSPQWQDGALLILCENYDSQKGIEECRKHFKQMQDGNEDDSTMPLQLPNTPAPYYADGSGPRNCWWESTHVWAVERHAKLGVVLCHHLSG